MTKRTGVQALRDDLAAERALLERLTAQKGTRLAEQEAARRRVIAVDEAQHTSESRIQSLEAALAALQPMFPEEGS